MTSVKRLTLVAAALAATLGTVSVPAAGDDAADYEITVTGLWTADRFPLEYPKAGVLTGPHFSGVIGASHNGGFALFRTGATPTPGLERLSEEGKHAPLDAEIKAAIAAGTAGALFESDPIKDFGKSVTSRVHVTSAFPEVSAVAMIAPSPDWFAGVVGVSLQEGGAFVAEKTVELYAYDSGGDNGATYTAVDADNKAKQATMAASARHFGGKPVARITFRKI
ncbi:MAG: spondin domain-containing protein [Gammaproteobacteria bacterium]